MQTLEISRLWFANKPDVLENLGAATTCFNHHLLQKRKLQLQWHQQLDRHSCSVCMEEIDYDSPRWRCLHSCDHNVCEPCFLEHADKCDMHTRSIKELYEVLKSKDVHLNYDDGYLCPSLLMHGNPEFPAETKKLLQDRLGRLLQKHLGRELDPCFVKDVVAAYSRDKRRKWQDTIKMYCCELSTSMVGSEELLENFQLGEYPTTELNSTENTKGTRGSVSVAIDSVGVAIGTAQLEHAFHVGAMVPYFGGVLTAAGAVAAGVSAYRWRTSPTDESEKCTLFNVHNHRFQEGSRNIAFFSAPGESQEISTKFLRWFLSAIGIRQPVSQSTLSARRMLSFQSDEAFKANIMEGKFDSCTMELSPNCSLWFFPEGVPDVHAMKHLSLEHFDLVIKHLDVRDIQVPADILFAQLGNALHPAMLDRTVLLIVDEDDNMTDAQQTQQSGLHQWKDRLTTLRTNIGQVCDENRDVIPRPNWIHRSRKNKEGIAKLVKGIVELH